MNIPDFRSTFESLVSELRAKRLLPVIGVLVVALIAIPLLLSKSSSPAPAPAAPVLPGGSTGTASPASAVPAVSQTPAGGSNLGGKGRDPFVQPLLPLAKSSGTSSSAPAGTAASTGTAAAKSSAASTGSSGSSGSSSGSPASSGSTSSSSGTSSSGSSSRTVVAPKPSQPRFLAYAIKLQFGAAGSRPRTYSGFHRLSTLPSARQPILIYLGVASDRRTAVFAVSAAASPAGDGTCVPSSSNCHFLELTPGERELLLVVNEAGGVTEYSLRYIAVHVQQGSSAGAGKPISRVGLRLVANERRMVPLLAKLSYDTRSGLLTTRFTSALAQARAHADAASTAS